MTIPLIPNEEIQYRYIEHFPIQEIKSNFYCEKPSRSFIESIRTHGVLEPIILDSELNLKVGRRRVLACKEIGKETIPARVITSNGFNASAMPIIENEQRSNNPVSDYVAIKDMLRQGYSRDDIINATGMNKATFNKRCKLFNLIPEMETLFLNGNIGVTVAEKSSTLTEGKQKRLANIYIRNGKIRVKDVKKVKKAVKEQQVGLFPDHLFENDWQDEVKQLLTIAKDKCEDLALADKINQLIYNI